MRRGVTLLIGAVTALVVAVGPPAVAQDPAIAAFDSGGQGRTEFTTGQRMVVLGRNFPAPGTVTITFRQQEATELGAFSVAEDRTFRADTQIPEDAAEGQATLEAVSGQTRATTTIQVVAVAATTDPEATPPDTATPTVVPGAPVSPTPVPTPTPTVDPITPDTEDRGLVDTVTDLWPFLLAAFLLAAALVLLLLLRRRQGQDGPRPPGGSGLERLSFDEGGEGGPTTQVMMPLDDDVDESGFLEEDDEPPQGGSSLVWDSDDEFAVGGPEGRQGSGGGRSAGRRSGAVDRLRRDVEGWTVGDD